MTFNEIINELEAIETVRQRLKERSMVYQCDAKEELARANKVPLNSYYYLPYDEWRNLYAVGQFSIKEGISS